MTHPVDIHVGKRIRQLRQAKKISQTELAEAIGVTFQQVQKYEKAQNRVSASKLYEMAKVFKVKISHFFVNIE